MAIDGSPPSKKKKLCKDVGGSSEEASSEEEAYQSTTSPKKSQEKLSARHSGSSSQEQTPQPETSRSQTFAAQTPPKDLQETEPSTSAGTSEETEERKCLKCGQSFIKEALQQHIQLNLCEKPGNLTPSTETSSSQTSPSQEETPLTPESPISLAQTPPKDLQQTEPSTSAAASEETIELRMCPFCEQFLTKEALYLHFVMGTWIHWPRRKLTPSPTSSAQSSPENLQETEQTRYLEIPPSIVITALISSLRTYRVFVELSQQTPSAGTLRTSEETEELHTCPKCKKSFTSILSLIYHLLKIHYKSKSPSQEQSPSAQTSQPSTSQPSTSQPSTSQPSTSQPSTSQPISPAEDLSTIDLINELIKLLETYRREIEHSPSAGTSRTSEETEESHTCSKCGYKYKQIRQPKK